MALSGFNVAKLCCSAFATVGVAVAMHEPLVMVENSYPVHLFPNDEEFKYRVSALHEHSQNLHIATLVFLGFLLVSQVYSLLVGERSTFGRGQIRSTFVLHTMSVVLYLAALWTLLVVGKHIKDQIDDFPIPVPNVKVNMALGSQMDIMGFFGLLASYGLTLVTDFLLRERSGYEAL